MGSSISWLAGWINLLGQVAGVASSEYASAQILLAAVSISRDFNWFPTSGQTVGGNGRFVSLEWLSEFAVNVLDGKMTKTGVIFHFETENKHSASYVLASVEKKPFSGGEAPGVHDGKEILKIVGHDRGELAMAFNFEIVDIDHGPEGRWSPRPFKVKPLKEIINKWQTFMLENAGWNALYMENYDQSRTVSHYCSDDPKYRTISAKMLAGHLGFQSGIGTTEKYKDIEVLNRWKTVFRDHPNNVEFQDRAKRQYWLIWWDNGRTPVQWNGRDKYAGFTTEDPHQVLWMEIHPDYTEWNVDDAVNDTKSAFRMHQLYRHARRRYGDEEATAEGKPRRQEKATPNNEKEVCAEKTHARPVRGCAERETEEPKATEQRGPSEYKPSGDRRTKKRTTDTAGNDEIDRIWLSKSGFGIYSGVEAQPHPSDWNRNLVQQGAITIKEIEPRRKSKNTGLWYGMYGQMWNP
ncbi:glycoside hydrolase superfamily [Lipomyces kononenkoae]|uniref:Glycoside hydrolase superfamily n=1 Tax=Lipomyces kononenkoae TaxID=34357 RepID=A0ACC3SYL1_LIPKO